MLKYEVILFCLKVTNDDDKDYDEDDNGLSAVQALELIIELHKLFGPGTIYIKENLEEFKTVALSQYGKIEKNNTNDFKRWKFDFLKDMIYFKNEVDLATAVLIIK